ncbi:MAG: site-specific integrase [Planctomycetes bacterium]|nr:site-specific integrase [Planctomycetota bacterium]
MSRGRGLGPGRLFKRGKSWVLDYRDEHGDRRHVALATTKREAEALQAELITRRNRTLLGLEAGAKDIALRELRDLYLTDLASRAGDGHVLNVTQQLAKILEALPGAMASQLRPQHYLAYRAAQKEAGRGNRCCNVHLQAIRGMLTWAVKLELLDKNPLAGIAKLPTGKKHQKRQRRDLSEAEIERFLQAAEDYDLAWGAGKARVPQAPFWRALVDTGARYGEVRQLTWSDFDEENALLHLRAETTKAGVARSIPMTKPLFEAVRGLRSEHWRVLGKRPGLGDPIFLSPKGCGHSHSTNIIRRTFDQLLKHAHVEQVDALGRKVDIHALRHTFITRLQRAGVSLVHAQRLAGHADMRLTAAVYTHVGEEDLREAIALLPSGSAPQTPRDEERRAV